MRPTTSTLTIVPDMQTGPIPVNIDETLPIPDLIVSSDDRSNGGNKKSGKKALQIRKVI